MSFSHNMADSLWKFYVSLTVRVQCNLLLNLKNSVLDKAADVSFSSHAVKTPDLQ